jgi:hypothetical protein
VNTETLWIGRSDTSVYGFTRRYLPFTVLLTTALGVIITALFGSWPHLLENLITSYCIGTIILLSNLVLRVFLLRRFPLSFPLQVLPYAATIPLAFVLGMPLGNWLTGQEHGNVTIGAIFSVIGGSFAFLCAERRAAAAHGAGGESGSVVAAAAAAGPDRAAFPFQHARVPRCSVDHRH